MLDPVVRKGATPASSQTGASNTAVAAIHADYQLAFELAGLKPKAVQKITDSLALINKLKAAVPHDCVADIIKIFDLKNKPERIDFVIDTLKTIGFDSAADTPLLQEAHGPYADLNIFALLKQMRLDGVKSAEDRQILYD